MARVTIEDCLNRVENHFQLVAIAAKRARQLNNGFEPQLEIQADKPTVVALREVAAGKVGKEVLQQSHRLESVDILDVAKEHNKKEQSMEEQLREIILEAQKKDEEKIVLNTEDDGKS